MKYFDYLKDKIVELFVFIVMIILSIILFELFKCHVLLKMSFVFIYILLYIVIFVYDYVKRNKFYKEINEKLNQLDKKYLIVELIKEGTFLDASIFIEYLYQIDKSFIEEVNKYKIQSDEFREYIELWCHEIKTPIATSKLIIDNNKNKVTDSISEEINSIESYVEQVLFYSRSENVEKDYILNTVNLKELIDSVILSNKKDIILKNIKINMFKEEVSVKSDSKWLFYIINQIIINSIKYSKDKKPSISISIISNKNNKLLTIEDNGIGIDPSEIDRVFDKGFTGTNGRNKYNSTGMGLFLSKKLCDKLGHDIHITSKYNTMTKVTIIFPNSSMYN